MGWDTHCIKWDASAYSTLRLQYCCGQSRSQTAHAPHRPRRQQHLTLVLKVYLQVASSFLDAFHPYVPAAPILPFDMRGPRPRSPSLTTEQAPAATGAQWQWGKRRPGPLRPTVIPLHNDPVVPVARAARRSPGRIRTPTPFPPRAQRPPPYRSPPARHCLAAPRLATQAVGNGRSNVPRVA